MRAFYKLLIANFKQFFRDRTALFFTFAFPLLFMLIFGAVFSNEGDLSYDIGLVRSESSVTAASISQALGQVPIFKISEGELSDKLAELKNGDLRAVIVIPADIDASVASGKTADMTVYYDPAQTSSAQVILPVLDQVVTAVNQQLTQQPPLLELAEESIQSRHLRAIDYLAPGILAMSILFLGLFGGLPLVEWREKKVLKRFGATPLRRSTLISSQIAYRLVLAVLQTVIIVAVARLIFNVQVIGSWLLLFAMVLLGTLSLVSIGYLTISRARTTEGAMPVIQLVQFPMLFLSGIFFQVEMMPAFMRPIVNAMPLTYLADAFRQIMVESTPLYSLETDAAVLAAWMVVCMVLAIRFFRWE